LLREDPITSSGTVTVTAASKAQQQTGTSATVAVTPSQQQSHDSAAKAWVMFTGSTTNGAQTINASYNVTSVTRTSTGTYTVAFTTAFASSSYACSNTFNDTTTNAMAQFTTQAAGSIVAQYVTPTPSLTDPTNGAYVICFGRQ
jgi:hypothetical protein